MASLAQLPEIVGFFSYSREDDEGFKGSLSALRDAVARELGAQLGRTKRNFRLWQDQEAIAPGKDWEAEITKAVEQSVFFIPIVTPRAVGSDYCKLEFAKFVAREKALGRDDLVFPILYISVPALLDEAEWRDDPVLSVVAKRQYVDWRPFRHAAVGSPAFGQAIERFCGKIVETLREPWLSQDERRQMEAEARRRAEEERLRLEAEAKGRAEEVERARQEAEAKKRAEDERRRREETDTRRRQAEDADRQRKDSEAKTVAKLRAGQERPAPVTPPLHWIVVCGVVYLVAGVIAIGGVASATVANLLVVGSMMIVAGAAEVTSAFQIKTWSRLLFSASGIFYIIAGFVAFGNPLLTAVYLTLILGAALTASGFVRIFFGFNMQHGSPWVWVVAPGVITLLLGLIIIFHWPISSLWTLAVLLSVDLIFTGASRIGLGIGLKQASPA